MIDFIDDSKSSYYEYSKPGCVNVDRVKLQNMFAGSCNENIDGAFGLVSNVRMMWMWATTRLSLATGVQGPLMEVYNNNHFCGHKKPNYYIEYPAVPRGSCILNLTDTLANPNSPVPLHYRWYFTATCLDDKINMVIQEFKELNEIGLNSGSWRKNAPVDGVADFRVIQQGHPKRCLQTPNITRYVTQVCQTDGRDSWRAGLFGCGFVNPSSDASKRL